MPDFHDLLILMVVIWTAGKVFSILKLPVVFGELLGGIIVGPSLLNLVSEGEVISVLADLGVFFLMLHAGMHANPGQLLKFSGKSLLIAIGGMLLLAGGGYGAASLFGIEAIPAAFITICLLPSAVPLVARFLTENKLQHTSIGNITLGGSIISDILTLIIFSLFLNFAGAEAGTDSENMLWLLAKIVLFFGVVIYGGMKSAPFLNRIIYFGNKGFTLTLIIALCMGIIAEAIGLHMIIGAFLAGLFMQQEVLDERVFDKIEDRVYGLSYSFFGPIFFASLAFNIDFDALSAAPLLLLSIVAVAIAGKVIGSGGTALLLKYPPLEAGLIGLIMNNRGTVELIIASIGLQAGIIDQSVFSILVMMAFGATIFSILATAPLAKRLKAV